MPGKSHAPSTIPEAVDDMASVVLRSPDPPTMDAAFTTLIEALRPQFLDDLPSLHHCHDIACWYADGNRAMAWRHAVALLERALGERLTHQ